MENPFELLMEKLIAIEKRIICIENQLCPQKRPTKKKEPLMTDEEVDAYLIKAYFTKKR
jgi:hypothetical protein